MKSPLLALNDIRMIQSVLGYSHVTTFRLSWHVQNYYLTAFSFTPQWLNLIIDRRFGLWYHKFVVKLVPDDCKPAHENSKICWITSPSLCMNVCTGTDGKAVVFKILFIRKCFLKWHLEYGNRVHMLATFLLLFCPGARVLFQESAWWILAIGKCS